MWERRSTIGWKRERGGYGDSKKKESVRARDNVDRASEEQLAALFPPLSWTPARL